VKKMHWLKKTVFGMFFTFFLFITAGILAGAGMDIFSPSFLSIGGLVLLLSMGALETNLVTYS